MNVLKCGGFWLPLLLALVVPTSYGEDICSNKTAWPDSQLCREPQVAMLDGQLNAIYWLLQGAAKDATALRNEQQKWLKTVRNVCPDNACLSSVYRYRIGELSARFANTVGITDKPLLNAEAQQICGEVAQMASKGVLEKLEIPPVWNGWSEREKTPPEWSLSHEEQAELEKGFNRPTSVFLLRTAANQPPRRFVEFYTGGTCSASQIFDLEHARIDADSMEENSVEAVSDPQEEIRWAYWGGADFPIFYKQRTFLVASTSDSNHARLLSWVKPDGVVRPLCMFDQEAASLAVAKAAKPELCANIADGKLTPLPWLDITDQTNRDDADSFTKRYGEYASTVRLLRIDLEGDGKTENLGRLEYESGAGCGRTDMWLKLLSDDLSRAIDGPSSALLAKMENGPRDVYQFKGQHYFASSDGKHRDGIVQINNGKVEQVCEFKPVTQRVVSQFFELSQ